MKRGLNLLVIALVFLVGVAVGYGIGFGVWGVTPNEVGRLQERVRHFTERAFGVESARPASIGPVALLPRPDATRLRLAAHFRPRII